MDLPAVLINAGEPGAKLHSGVGGPDPAVVEQLPRQIVQTTFVFGDQRIEISLRVEQVLDDYEAFPLELGDLPLIESGHGSDLPPPLQAAPFNAGIILANLNRRIRNSRPPASRGSMGLARSDGLNTHFFYGV